VILSTSLSSFADLFEDKLTLPQFLSGLAKWAQNLPEDPAQWELGDMKRQSDGAFQDGELVELLRVATENVAGKFICNAGDLQY
jgi:linoleate 10R-lipoxygenase